MPVIQQIRQQWQHQRLIQQASWILLLLFLSYYLLWHFPLIAGKVSGPYYVAIFVHQFFTVSFWLLLLLAIPVGLVLSFIAIRGHRLKLLIPLILGLLGFSGAIIVAVINQVASNPNEAGAGLIFALFLSSLLSMLGVVITTLPLPQPVRRKPILAYLTMLMTCILMSPCGLYFVDNVDQINIQEWGRSYHLAYRNVPDMGLGLELFECGPTKLLCHSVHRFCMDVGPSPEPNFLDWSNDRLTMRVNGKIKYQRSKDTVLFEKASVRGLGC